MSDNTTLLPSYFSCVDDEFNFHQRSTDNFVNASVLCQKFGLQLRHWFTQPETLAQLISLDYELKQQSTQLHPELDNNESELRPSPTKYIDWSNTTLTISTIAQRFPHLVKYARASHQLDAGCWIAPQLLDTFKQWLISRPVKLDTATTPEPINYHCTGVVFPTSNTDIKLLEHNGFIEVGWVESVQRKFSKWLQRHQTILMVSEIATKHHIPPQPRLNITDNSPQSQILASLYPQLIQIIPERKEIWLQSEVAKAYCLWATPDYNRIKQQDLIRTINLATKDWQQRQQLREYCWTINPPQPLHQGFLPNIDSISLRVLFPHERAELLDKSNCTLLRLWMTDSYAFLFCLENGLLGFPNPNSLSERLAKISLDTKPLIDPNLYPNYGFFTYQSALKILSETPSVELIQEMLEQWQQLILPYLEQSDNSTMEAKLAVTNALDALSYRSPYWQENVVSFHPDEVADNQGSGEVSKAVRTTVEFAGATLELFMLPNGEYFASQTSTSASLGKDNTSIMRFSTSNAVKSMLGRRFELCSLTITDSKNPLKQYPWK